VELFPDCFLYDEDELPARLKSSLKAGRLTDDEAKALTDRFGWEHLAPTYQAWIAGENGQVAPSSR
jgi:hypothetical protein